VTRQSLLRAGRNGARIAPAALVQTVARDYVAALTGSAADAKSLLRQRSADLHDGDRPGASAHRDADLALETALWQISYSRLAVSIWACRLSAPGRLLRSKKTSSMPAAASRWISVAI
jgi:hypothetical protein